MRIRQSDNESEVHEVRRFVFSIVVAFLAFSTAACGDNDTAEGFPTGTFELDGNPSVFVEFNPDGSFVWTFGSDVVTGTYSTEGDEYFEESNDYGPCLDLVPSPPYVWAFDGETLTFELAGEDPCAPRASSVDGANYVVSDE